MGDASTKRLNARHFDGHVVSGVAHKRIKAMKNAQEITKVLAGFVAKAYDEWTWEEAVKAAVGDEVRTDAIDRAAALVRGAYRKGRQTPAEWAGEVKANMAHIVAMVEFEVAYTVKNVPAPKVEAKATTPAK